MFLKIQFGTILAKLNLSKEKIMLQITPFSSACVKADSYADYIPFVSTISNIVDIFLKYVFQPCYGESNLQNNHFFAYLETKHLLRSIILLIPVLGNALTAGIDMVTKPFMAPGSEGLATSFKTISA